MASRCSGEPEMPCITNELKSVVLTLETTAEAKGREEVGKNGSQPSLGLAGWMKTERGTGVEATGSTKGAARTGNPDANKKKNQAAFRTFKDLMHGLMEFMGFRKR